VLYNAFQSARHPQKCPFLWGHLHSHPTHGSLDPPDSASQTAYRSIQPFLDILRQKSTIFCNGLPLPPSKLPLRREIVFVAERILTRAQMGDRLATIDMGRKEGAAVSLSVGGLGPHLIQCCLGGGLPPYQVASWSILSFRHNTSTLQTVQTDSTTVR